VIRVLVVDDHTVVRQGLRFLLTQEDDIDVVGDAADGAHALVEVRSHHPDVVLLDLIMPPPDGLTVLAALRRDHPDVAVVILTSSAEDDHVIGALRGGALSYIAKTARADDIVNAVRAAARGEGVLTGAPLRRLLLDSVDGKAESGLGSLSPRELDVLSGVARGRSNREIAASLAIGEETVKSHVSRILAKLGVQDRTQAAIVALQHRLVPLDEALDPDPTP
jgi:NarL family two-component system response regulator LiaR